MTKSPGDPDADRLYEAVHARPDGDASVARLARTAADQGYNGLVIRNHGDAMADFDAARVADACDIDIVDGVEIRTNDRERAGGYLGSHRPSHTVVCVHGGRLNRFAVEQDRVDVLAHPMREGDLNHVLVKAAAEHGVRLEVDLSGVLRAHGSDRVRSVQGLQKLMELIRSFEAPYVVSADPSSHLQLRAPRELAAVGAIVGLDPGEVYQGLRAWGRLAARNRDRVADEFIEPGVRTVHDEPRD